MDELKTEDTEEFRWSVIQGDCLEVLKGCPDHFFDSVISDPPAGVSFMNRAWDSDKGGRDQWIAWLTEIITEVWRVLKPGGHAFIWALPRTSSWTCRALEDADFEIRTICHHHFGNGFPKSQDVGKSIDKMEGAEREIVGQYIAPDGKPRGLDLGIRNGRYGISRLEPNYSPDKFLTAPASDLAKKWDGWGSALKPSTEHYILARKPLSESSIARNVLCWGTGALNIDACRVPGVPEATRFDPSHHSHEGWRMNATGAETAAAAKDGRWPPDLLLTCCCETPHDDPSCPVAEIDRQSGFSKSTAAIRRNSAAAHNRTNSMGKSTRDWTSQGHSDSGGASRFFPTFRYQAKPSRAEKDAGLEALENSTLNRVNPGGLEHEPRWAPVQVKNPHPTVKGIELCRWLCRLITPPGGTVLDMFAGSGSIGCAALLEGFKFVGIEDSEEYCEIARARLAYWEAQRNCKNP